MKEFYKHCVEDGVRLEEEINDMKREEYYRKKAIRNQMDKKKQCKNICIEKD